MPLFQSTLQEAGMLVELAVAAALTQEAPADITRRVRGIANGRLSMARKVISDQELVRAIAVKNKVSESQDDVKRKDEQWRRSLDFPPRQEAAANECAQRLKAVVQEDPAIQGAYLMDARGTIVCSTTDVPDYWQGDEEDFQRTFGRGQFLFVGEPAADPGTPGGWTIPLSMVVLDGPMKIGAATLTLKVTPEMLAPPPAPTPAPPPTVAPAATPEAPPADPDATPPPVEPLATPTPAPTPSPVP